jgi:hypothetical protein
VTIIDDPAPSGDDFVLGPATRLLWRSPHSIHLELGEQAVVVEGLPASAVSRVVAHHPPPDPAASDPAITRALVDLADAGYLWPRIPESGEYREPGPAGDHSDPRRAPPHPRLAGELTALAVTHAERAAEVLAARGQASVVVHGRSRAAAHLGAVLAAAGVGRVHCVAGGTVRLHQAMPGGVLPGDEGLDLSVAADTALHRAAPEVDTTPPPPDQAPDLTVLAIDAPIDDDRRVALHAAGAAHLVVSLGADRGTVGPLVLPGLTSCLRCADLHRRDRDPAWSALAVQLTVPRRGGSGSDVAVSTVVVGAAALQALAFLDGGDPACVDGTLELRLPDWRLRRRSRPPHPDCDCALPADPGR